MILSCSSHSSLYKGSTYLILCGDFNINNFDVSSRKHLLETLLASFNLSSTVTFPTRIATNSSTLIDNIYIDINCCNFTVYPLINGLSDHDAQVIKLSNLFNINPKNHYTFTRRIDSNSTWTFIDLLSYENWEEVFLEDNVNIIFNNFLNTYLRIFNASFPVVKSKESTKSNPWLTTGIRISCTTKRNLYATYRNSMDPNFKAYYKKYCKILSSVIRAAKKMHFDSLIRKSTNKIKTTWNIVKSLTNNKTTTNKTNTRDFNNNQKTANAFNLYFSSVAEKLIKNSLKENRSNRNDPLTYLRQNFKQPSSAIKLKNTTTHEIDKIIHSMKLKDSHGYDEISTRILKMSAPYILSPLTFISNKTLSTVIYPDRLKYSEVKPLHKKGNTSDLSNYRPISLLTAFSKLIEKIIHKRLYHYLDQQKVFVSEQHGFRQKTSTETAAFSLLNTILLSLDKKKIVGGLFLD